MGQRIDAKGLSAPVESQKHKFLKNEALLNNKKEKKRKRLQAELVSLGSARREKNLTSDEPVKTLEGGASGPGSESQTFAGIKPGCGARRPLTVLTHKLPNDSAFRLPVPSPPPVPSGPELRLRSTALPAVSLTAFRKQALASHKNSGRIALVARGCGHGFHCDVRPGTCWSLQNRQVVTWLVRLRGVSLWCHT